MSFSLNQTEWEVNTFGLFLWLPVALFIYIVDFPGMFTIRIDIVALIIALYSIHRPEKLPLYLVFFVGCLQDLIALSMLGLHSIGLVLLAYYLQRIRDRLRLQGPLKQAPFIFVGLIALRFIQSWLTSNDLTQLPALDSFISAVVTLLCWPIVLKVTALSLRKKPRY